MTTQVEGEDESKTSSSPDRTKKDDDKPPDSDLPSIKNEPAGLTVEGDWEEITDFCDQFNYTLKKEASKEEVSTEDLTNWKDWRPRESRDETTVKERGAKHAAYQPEGSPEKDLKKSTSHINSSRQNIGEGKNKEAFKDLLAAIARAIKGILTYAGQVVGNLEHLIYRHVIAKSNSSYFDSDLLSANLEKEKSVKGKGKYKIQIKIHHSDLRNKVSDELKQ